MRKLNKIIKQKTKNKLTRKRKNIDVSEYFKYCLSIIDKNEKFKIERKKIEEILEVVFLEKYFHKEMIEAKVDIVEDLSNFLDFDLYAVDEKKIKEILGELYNPDNIIRNKMKLLQVRIPIIKEIMADYK